VIATADGTAWTCRVRVAVTDPSALADARELLTDLLVDVDLAASRFRADSERAAVDAANGAWPSIRPLFTELTAAALRTADSPAAASSSACRRAAEPRGERQCVNGRHRSGCRTGRDRQRLPGVHRRRHPSFRPGPDGGWQVRVEDVTGEPAAVPEGPVAVVRIMDGGLATASTHARRWQRDGLWLHHLISSTRTR
jgi:thiamine biosynthesis lipoprotein